MFSKEVKRYRIISISSKKIVEDDLSEQDAQTAYEMYKAQGRDDIHIEKIPIAGLGRDPDLH